MFMSSLASSLLMRYIHSDTKHTSHLFLHTKTTVKHAARPLGKDAAYILKVHYKEFPKKIDARDGKRDVVHYRMVRLRVNTLVLSVV